MFTDELKELVGDVFGVALFVMVFGLGVFVGSTWL